MRTMIALKRWVVAAAGAGLLALLLSSAIPHDHAHASANSSPSHACRICKIHEGASLAPPPAPVSLVAAAPSALGAVPVDRDRSTLQFIPLHASRAPPRLA